MHLMSALSLPLSISLLNPSMIVRNNSGDNGKPFLTPLVPMKECAGDPLIYTA